jgi:putative transposase
MIAVSDSAKHRSDEELQVLRRAVQRGRRFGTPVWEKQAASRLGLHSTLRPRGRPRKKGGE